MNKRILQYNNPLRDQMIAETYRRDDYDISKLKFENLPTDSVEESDKDKGAKE
jgi:hypothetical protein